VQQKSRLSSEQCGATLGMFKNDAEVEVHPRVELRPSYRGIQPPNYCLLAAEHVLKNGVHDWRTWRSNQKMAPRRMPESYQAKNVEAGEDGTSVQE
jgi:hypothetical protein